MNDALSFLITTFTTLFSAALIMRAWIFWRRIPPFNPYSRFIFSITDFLVTPVRNIIPSSVYIDWPSLLLAWLACVLQVVLTSIIDQLNPNLLAYVLFGLYFIIQNALTLVIWLSVIYALMTWINPNAPFVPFLRLLIEPLLVPIRKILPPPLKNQMVDFSLMFLMILLIALQIALPSLFMLPK